jgi:restriction system protein
MTWMGSYFLPDALESLKNSETETEKHQVENAARETEAQLEAGRGAALSGDLEVILALSTTEFEYTVATILRMLGMTGIQRVGGRGHFGVDIIARDVSGRTILVQFTRRARTKKIGSPEIRKFIGTAHMHHQTDLRMFVTTSEFTGHAQALAHLHDIQLMNGSGIEELARKQRGSTP